MIEVRLWTGYSLHIPAEAAYLHKSETVSEVPEVWKDALFPYPTSNTMPSDGPYLCYGSAIAACSPCTRGIPRLQYWNTKDAQAGDTSIYCSATGFYLEEAKYV